MELCRDSMGLDTFKEYYNKMVAKEDWDEFHNDYNMQCYNLWRQWKNRQGMSRGTFLMVMEHVASGKNEW